MRCQEWSRPGAVRTSSIVVKAPGRTTDKFRPTAREPIVFNARPAKRQRRPTPSGFGASLTATHAAGRSSRAGPGCGPSRAHGGGTLPAQQLRPRAVPNAPDLKTPGEVWAALATGTVIGERAARFGANAVTSIGWTSRQPKPQAQARRRRRCGRRQPVRSARHACSRVGVTDSGCCEAALQRRPPTLSRPESRC